MEVSAHQNHNRQKGRKRVLEGAFFLLVMGLSFYTVFHGQDMGQVSSALGRLSPMALCLALFTALFFVSAEGIMIWYLLRSMNGKSGLLRCISYSFIGFFYSGITPSATGGQPMQLYYMCKDRNSLSESSVVLMTVALIYKFVLVIIGVAILICWHQPLKSYLWEYYPLFLLGLVLNLTLVLLLLAVMFAPGVIKRVVMQIEKLLVKIGILKPSAERRGKIDDFVDGYQGAVHFLRSHKRKVLYVCLFTFLQRCSVFVLTWIVYRGFALEGTDAITVMFLQASVYIAVDMLPLPGAQGITELMYRSIFRGIFTGGYLMPSLYVTRGVSFYFLLIVGMVVSAANYLYRRRRDAEDVR
ncbi:MAG: flippase-like domain-containing protein [Lachnospiraceae bacterium]|nr:flippase-like domain-containing protein [Lachnospiraceae bacterium]